MKLLLRLLFIIILTLMAYGFYLNKNEMPNGEKFIGISVFIGAFIYMPFFLFYRWKDKSLKDYTLTEENIKKIKRTIWVFNGCF